jgi:riboflavin kinase/FMN adenylyltransferase
VLTTLQEKQVRFQAAGVDHLVIEPFTEKFSAMLPEQYVHDFLVKHFQPAVIVIGYNHRFGKNRSGDVALLRKLSPRFGYQVELITQQQLNQMEISSTKIREALLRGELRMANQLLGYPFSFEGKVVEGNRKGHSIGFPTANLEPSEPDKLLPMDGVYAVKALLKNEQLTGMMNIGFRPTVDGSRHVVEVHLFDFDRDIYGETLRVEPLVLLRREQKFESIDALARQLRSDKQEALRALAG